MVQQLAARIDALRMQHEEAEQAIFGRADRNHLVAREDAVRGGIQTQATEVDRITVRVRLGAAEHGLDPGHQLPRGKGLDHIVVDTCIEPLDLVVFLAPRGQHDDRNLARQRFLAQAARHFKATHARQHPVEQDEIRNLLGDCVLRDTRVGGLDGIHARPPQRESDHVADRGFILDDQDTLVQSHCPSVRKRSGF